jgi:hypothetical protein
MHIPTSAGLIRVTTTIITTVAIIKATDARGNPSVDGGVWQAATPLTLPSPTKRRKR